MTDYISIPGVSGLTNCGIGRVMNLDTQHLENIRFVSYSVHPMRGIRLDTHDSKRLVDIPETEMFGEA